MRSHNLKDLKLDKSLEEYKANISLFEKEVKTLSDHDQIKKLYLNTVGIIPF